MKIIPSILLTLTFAALMSVSAYADDDLAQSLSYATGWDVTDIQFALEESFIGDSEITPLDAENALLGEMRQYSEEFTSCNVKFECIASIAALETGHFRYTYNNNVGGITNSSGYVAYDTIEDGIAALDILLTEYYLDPDGLWYEGGTTILEVSQHYNTSFQWLACYVDVRLSMKRRIDNGRT